MILINKRKSISVDNLLVIRYIERMFRKRYLAEKTMFIDYNQYDLSPQGRISMNSNQVSDTKSKALCGKVDLRTIQT